MGRRRRGVGSAAVVLVIAAGCSDATGTSTGGTPLFDASPAPTPAPAEGGIPGGSTWAELYGDYFGPGAHASCARAGCHLTAADPGAAGSGFVCGPTKEECHASLTATGTNAPKPPLLEGQTFQDTRLHRVLRKTSPAEGIMPASSTFAFAPSDVRRLSDWFTAGKKND